jgi:5-methylcytosine-specific restriction enzyme subunit McrC
MLRAFESYFQENERTPFFELIPNGVRFKQYVGAIQVGNTTIEVLPKAGKEGNEESWQGVLLDMLKACHLLTAKETGTAQLRLRSNSVLDLYFELFIQEVEDLFHQGLIKKYRTRQGQQKALRGSLVFSQHLRKNIVHKERFYTRHSTYDRNHLLHQILIEALSLVELFSTSPHLQDRIGRLKLDFPEVSPLKIKASHFDKLKLDRKSYPYRKAIEIAKLLILNFRPDISSGKQDLLAIMFDMNQLWEEYIFQTLKRKVSSEWMVMSQQSRSFWEHKKIRPDLILKSRRNPDETYVIDTKWKVIDNRHPADDDLKQMYVYNHHWDSTHSMLLYPRSSDQQDNRGMYSLKQNEMEHHCILGFVDVLDNGRLSQNIAEEIIEKVCDQKQVVPDPEH